MQDFIGKYKKKTIFTHFSLLTLSFIFALSFYTYTKDSTFTSSLKGNVLEQVAPEDDKGELFLESTSDEIQKVILNKKIENISSISFSLTFDPENINISSINALPGVSANVEIVSNTPGFITALINFNSPVSYNAMTELFSVNTSKLTKEISFINVLQANVTDTSNTITNLSSSGIDF